MKTDPPATDAAATQRHRALVLAAEHDCRDVANGQAGALYGIARLEAVGWGLDTVPGRSVDRRTLPSRAERWLSLRAGRQIGFPVGIDFGEAAMGWRHVPSVDVALAVLEQHAIVPAALRRIPGSPWRGVPLAALTCWTAERVLHLSPARRATLARAAQGVDRWLVFSRNQVPILSERLDIDADRIRFVPFGIDADGVATAVARRDRSPCAPRVLSVGKDIGRDYATLFRAADAIPGRLRVACWERNLPRDLATPENVDLVGRLAQPAYEAALADCDIVVLPTHDIAYPTGQTVLLQAWAAGKAVVTTDRAAIRDYVTDGVDGVLVPPSDPAAMASAVVRLLEDDDTRLALGRAGAERVRSSFTEGHLWDAVAKELDELVAIAGR